MDALHAVEADLADSANGVRWGSISGMPGGFADGVDNTGSGGDSDWIVSGNDMYSAVIGDVGIGVANPATKLDVRGTLAVGADGAGHDVNFYGISLGTKVFWDADNMAFRAGNDDLGYWMTSDSVGTYSFAAGSYVKAMNTGSIALGQNCTARGSSAFAAGEVSTANANNSTAIGGWCKAKGNYSVAIGENAEASEMGAHAIGSYVTAAGSYSRAIGRYLKANSASSYVIGTGDGYGGELINGTANSLMVGFSSDIPTLFVGPSSGTGTTGRIGIGTSTPDDEAKLSIQCASDNFGVLVNATNTSGSQIGLHSADSEYSSLAKNCYFFGGSWYRYNTLSGAYLNEITPDGHVWFKTAGPGTGGITWVTGLAIRSSGNVGIGITNPARSLHVSDVMRLQPRSAAPGSPSEGDLYVNSSNHHIYCYLGGSWKQLDN
jgi:hypothetical protein